MRKFRLAIYCMLLSDQTLINNNLGLLFYRLPDFYIVLFEDIDVISFIQKRTIINFSNIKLEEG